MSEIPDYLRLWGKANNDDGVLTWHPLAYHMLDVAAVAWIWLETDAQLLNLVSDIFWKDESALSIFSLSIALHDIGKASLGFQNKIPELAKSAGLEYSGAFHKHFDHGAFGGEWILNRMDQEHSYTPLLNEEWFRELWKSACWHHGSLIQNYENYSKDAYIELKYNEKKEDNAPQNKIQKLRGEIIDYIEKAILGTQGLRIAYHQISSSSLRFFAGFVSTCDWIGSDKSRFEYNQDYLKPEEYFRKAKENARDALKEFGLIKKPGRVFSKFKDLFPEIKIPRNLQTRIEEIQFTEKPYLLIIEAPTGEGKTESALFAHSKSPNRGFFFGLPTQSSANQISNRVNHFLFENLKTNQEAILAHGSAWLHREITQDRKYDGLQNNTETIAETELSEWFFSKKRTLLAPFGVGTVDQAMLAALNVKHGFVKLFSLSGKTLIIDEVHAYDSFMLPILERLLEWCATLKTNVILLSATLPSFMKARLLEAYSGNDLTFQKDKYPLISYVETESTTLQEYSDIQTRKEEIISLQFSTHTKNEISEIAEGVLRSIKKGGNVLWICNTIAKAQLVYSFLKEYKDTNQDSFYLKLFHSRFTFQDRRKIEQEIETLFGPKQDASKRIRPARGILVSTQVAEQSLDIDFDYLVTDIAPIDLLLQRLGRIHRHIRSNRPDHFAKPQVLILVPINLKELNLFSSMYYKFTIAKTMNSLSEISELLLPQMYRSLVEQVYSADIPQNEILTLGKLQFHISKNEWGNLFDQLKQKQEELDTKGSKGRISSVWTNTEDILQDTLLSEDDNAYFSAKTRDGETSLQLVPVMKAKENYNIGNFLLQDKPPQKVSISLQTEIAENSIPVSSPKGFVQGIVKSEIFRKDFHPLLAQWQKKLDKTGPLKGKYLLLLDATETTSYTLGNTIYNIKYDKEFGLRIQVQKEN